jgi:hypothetical protein
LQPHDLLPKRVVKYIHEMGVRAMDQLADEVQPPQPEEGEAGGPNAVHTLVDHWKSMTKDDKEEFIDRIAGTVVEVIAASAVLPLGLKLGKEAAKATRKVVKREAKKMRKDAKAVLRAAIEKKKDKARNKVKKEKEKKKVKEKVKARSKAKPRPRPRAKSKAKTA